jgi:PAS domain S-box-containing protein
MADANGAKVTQIRREQPSGRRLEDGHRLIETLCDSAVEYAIYMLDVDGVVKSWNSGAQRIQGYSAQEIVGSHFSVFYTEDDVRSGEPTRSLEMALSFGKYEAEGWRVRKDGSRLWASVVIDAVYSDSGALLGFSKVTATCRSEMPSGSV